MKNEVNRSFMDKKKNYNQPSTDVLLINTENMMQGLNVSVNSGGTPPGGGGMHAPGRGDLIP